MATTAPDLNLGRRFLERHPPPGELLFCAVSGAHLYGFPSPDSDIDLKGAHAAPVEEILGITPRLEAHNRLETFDGVECDLTTLEIGKVLTLVLQGNGNTVEQVVSPFQLRTGALLEELRELVRDALSRKLHRHYSGFFRGMQREHLRHELPQAKTLLYSFRVALTGIHLLKTGEVLPHLPSLAHLYGPAELHDLIALKMGGAERSAIPSRLDEDLRSRWPKLSDELDQALERSPLPKEAANQDAMERWLIDLRRRQLDLTSS